MALTLAKTGDTEPTQELAFVYSPVWQNTVKLAINLDKVFPPDRSDALYEALADNDLGALHYVWRHTTRRV